jgi:hypothetical protein
MEVLVIVVVPRRSAPALIGELGECSDREKPRRRKAKRRKEGWRRKVASTDAGRDFVGPLQGRAAGDGS